MYDNQPIARIPLPGGEVFFLAGCRIAQYPLRSKLTRNINPLNQILSSHFLLSFKLSFPPQGQAFINGFNAGRYWPGMGPQETLYIPKSALSTEPAGNDVILFEIDGPVTHSDLFVDFIDRPIWKGLS